ncbi:DHA2 family efflux MFS transporter permease subunit [Homoserinibacter sp. GY 40078]|uniref:DHA2 family efflux MFS transporter permease subunit n=1 Tax=Homoserinibacter sp. GY 40078 TaxID=2603275 RepID=UPI0011C9BB1C|nr:DHA2 family efflux MFS transporter permease subunit [Homoserinibacter sp. GY 40078]TXK18739.1 DHA2 family efflux MFS transporter permease subunit [Homoserinibacter sp. GY 40078]
MEQPVESARTRWLGLVVISIAVALIIVDSTIVNVAIPSVVDDLGISSTEVQWVQESYTLVFASLLLVFGTLADRVGRRRMLLLGVTLFALASVAAALAPSGELLIASRVIQGFGGAMILPATLSLLNATFTGRERGIAFAVWGSTIGGMAAVGPLLGGWLTTYFSWRWAFGINLPLGILIVVGALIVVRESKAPDAGRIDLVGALLSVVLFTSLVFGLIEGRTYGWWTSADVPEFWTLGVSPIPFAFALALAALIAFIAWGVHRQRQGRSTMIALSLFRLTSFRNGNIAALIVSLGEFGVILSLPLWLQNVLGYDALQTGFVLLALAGGSFIASGFAGASSGKVAPVWVVRAGLASEIVGLVIIGLVIATDTPWWQIALGLLVYGFGVGLATAQLTGVVLVDVPVEQSGQASGTQSTSRQVGSALGIAILGTVLFTSLGAQLDDRLPDQLTGDARQQVVDLVVDSAGAAIPSLDAQSTDAGDAARAAFSEATRLSAFTAAGFLGVGLVATLGLSARAADRSRGSGSAPRSAPADRGAPRRR